MGETAAKRPGPAAVVRRFVSNLGPGIVTGAADDDPSGIATYSIAGARFGTSLLWTAWLTWPLMAAVQMTCARVGMVTGRGLAGALRQRYPRWLLVCAASALFVANTINVGADLSGMADAAETLTRIDSHVWVVLFGAGISWAIVRFRYHQIASILKWLALVLFAYVLVAFRLSPEWRAVLRDALLPSRPRGAEWGMLVAILGTTISPYLFFWQASQEVEEDRALGRRMLVRPPHLPPLLLAERRLDVALGTFVSNLVMFFVILATALTLHRHGVTNPQTSHDVAQALRPLAGELTGALYTIGIVGVGLLAIPTLAGSSAYAFAETFGWRRGLDLKLRGARYFYGVIVLSTALGVALDFLNVNPVQALYWTAIVNGLLAPPLLAGILIFACSRRRMRGQPIPWFDRIAVGLAVALLTVAAVAMFVV